MVGSESASERIYSRRSRTSIDAAKPIPRQKAWPAAFAAPTRTTTAIHPAFAHPLERVADQRATDALTPRGLAHEQLADLGAARLALDRRRALDPRHAEPTRAASTLVEQHERVAIAQLRRDELADLGLRAGTQRVARIDVARGARESSAHSAATRSRSARRRGGRRAPRASRALRRGALGLLGGRDGVDERSCAPRCPSSGSPGRSGSRRSRSSSRRRRPSGSRRPARASSSRLRRGRPARSGCPWRSRRCRPRSCAGRPSRAGR